MAGDPYQEPASIAAIFAASLAAAAGMILFGRWRAGERKADRDRDEFLSGTDLEPGLIHEWPQFMRRFEWVETLVSRELSPNSGSSLVDRVERTAKKVDRMEGKLDTVIELSKRDRD